MTDWREERNIARFLTDSLFKDIIDSTLPNESSSQKNIPDYMIDFYNETNLTEEWINTSDNVKKFMLDAEIEQYMQRLG